MVRLATPPTRRATRAAQVLRSASIALAALVAATAVLFWLTGLPLGLDCAVYRAGALAVLHGKPLYATLPYLPFWATGMPFTYPPAAALLFTPIAWLPPQLFWGAVVSSSILALGKVLAVGIGRAIDNWPRIAVLALGAGSLALEPVWRGIGFGQIDALLMALVILDVLVLPSSPRRGVLIGLAAAVKLTPLIFVLHLFVTGRRADAGRALATFAGITAFSLITLPADSIRYWSTEVLGGPLFGDNPALSSAQVANQSLNGLIQRISDRASWAFPVAIVLGLALLAVVVPLVRRLAAHGEHLPALLVSAGCGLLVSPVSWTHHWVWVVPLLGLLVARAVTTRRFGLLAAFCVVFTGWFQLLVPHGDNAELHWNLPQSLLGNAYVLAALVTLRLLARCTRRARSGTDEREPRMHKLLIALRIGAWRLWTYFRRRPWSLTIGIAMLLLERLTPTNAAPWLLLGLGVLITGKGALDVVAPIIEDVKKSAALKSRPSPAGPLLRGYAGPYGDWERITANGEEAVHDPKLDAALRAGARIRMRADENLWLPPGKHEEVRKLKVPTLDFDEAKVRLVDDLGAHTTSVRVQRTPYSAFLVTNRLAAYQYRESNNPREALSFADVGLNADGLIPRFPFSKCSNHIGVDVLGISEGTLILQRQSGRNRLHGDQILGSGSGSADWADLPASGYELNTFVRVNMRREMTEELGLDPAEAPSIDDIRIVGFNRTTSLGGKPQFCGVARLGPVKLRIRRQEALYVDEYVTDVQFDPDDGVPALRAALDRLETTYQRQLAFPLFVTCQLIKQWLDTDPTAPVWLGLDPG